MLANHLGVQVADAVKIDLADVGISIPHVERAMPQHGPDLEAAVSQEFELVSISKQKLENLKSQVRAVQLRTHLTHIIDGTPYFRGRPLAQLMRQSSMPQMIYETLTKEDDGEELAAQLAKDLVLCATTNPTSEAAKSAVVASFQGGSPMNVAVGAGLLTLPAAGLKPLPASLHDRDSPTQADALAMIPQVVDLVACVLGNDLHWSYDESIQATIFHALSAEGDGGRGEPFAGDLHCASITRRLRLRRWPPLPRIPAATR